MNINFNNDNNIEDKNYFSNLPFNQNQTQNQNSLEIESKIEKNILEDTIKEKEKVNVFRHKKNLSNVECFLNKFDHSFIRGSYLNNINDFHIAESGTPKKDRMVIIPHLPNKMNQSVMDGLSNIDKKYKEKTNMVTTSWPLFHEK